jgi:hypothetical protein
MIDGRIRQGLAIAAWICAAAGLASGQATTVEGASVLVFPRVVVDGTWDTTIQISNSANRPLYARCFYVNGALADPTQPPGPSNPPVWASNEFSITLVRQQPTHWVASRGRPVDETDQPCGSMVGACDGAGLDPGDVPAVSAGFAGELRCIEVDASGAPWSGNALLGFATLTHIASGEIVKYPAVGLPGLQPNNADDTLCLGGAAREGCPRGAEYGDCPQNWIVSHPADADDRPLDGAAVSTDLTVVPCPENLETQSPQPLTLQFLVTNEFEQTFSAATTLTCWADLRLSNVSPVFQRDTLGGSWVETQIKSTAGSAGGFMLVQQTVRETAGPATYAAAGTVPHYEGVQSGGEDIVLPAEVGQ